MFAPDTFYTVVRLIRHTETFEVRVSTFFIYDDDASRGAVTGQPLSKRALRDATEFARAERVRTGRDRNRQA